MVKVVETEKMKELSAVYCVKIGRATPEQQQTAYRVFTRPKQHQPKKITKAERRNFTVWTILRYMEKVEEPMSHQSAYKEIAEIENVKPDTVRRDYERFMRLSEDEQNRVLKKVERHLNTN